MKNTTPPSAIQARMEELMKQLADDPLMGDLATPADLATFLQAGFSVLLHAALLKERELHLEQHPDDRANGYAPIRQLHIKTTPVRVRRPRTRGDFYPACLPKHQRHIPESYQELLEQVLLESRSFESALRTLQAIGAGYSRQ